MESFEHESLDNCSNHNLCISKVPIFSHLDTAEMVEINNVTVSKNYHKGEIIFLAGEPLEYLFIINQGKVKISRITESGKEQILRVLNPGDFMGELSLFGTSPLSNYAEALEPTEICLISKSEIEKIVYKFPSISLKLLAEFSSRMEAAENLIEQLGHNDVEQRVAAILLQLASKIERNNNNSINITLSVSKKDLASLIGTTQETLSRKLSSFQEKGWITLKGQRQITINDEGSLRELLSS